MPPWVILKIPFRPPPTLRKKHYKNLFFKKLTLSMKTLTATSLLPSPRFICPWYTMPNPPCPSLWPPSAKGTSSKSPVARRTSSYDRIWVGWVSCGGRSSGAEGRGEGDGGFDLWTDWTVEEVLQQEELWLWLEARNGVSTIIGWGWGGGGGG